MTERVLSRTHPTMSRAARMHRSGDPEVLVVEQVPLPLPGPDEVRIGVLAAGLNYPDLLIRSGRLSWGTLPFTPGFEVAGTVDALGPEVASLTVGAHVLAELPAGGGYAEHAIAQAANIHPLPAGLDPADGLALLTSGRTALLLLRLGARLQPEETIFIPGALGGVGSIAVQLAKGMGARVIAGVGSAEKREPALALGADAVVAYSRDGWSDEVKRLTEGRGADVVLQSGTGRVATESLRALAPLGRLVVFGADNVVSPDGMTPDQARSLLSQGQALQGFSLMRTPAAARQAALDELARAVSAGTLKPIVQRFPFQEVASSHLAMESRRTIGKIVLEVQSMGTLP